MCLLDAYDVKPAGQCAVVIGRSSILGKSVGMLLLARDATVPTATPKLSLSPAR
jgi:methylenetetrahydrofolate dehydrogenase (NADP+)/methenyltetrahydrofolate cyclohydrolase